MNHLGATIGKRMERWLIWVAMCALIVCGIKAQAVTQPQTPIITGNYAGMVGPLHLMLHLNRNEAGKVIATLDSVDQGAHGIICSDFIQSGQGVSFNVPAVHGTYRGTLSVDGEIIMGTWTQGLSTPLKFERQKPFIAAMKPSPVDGNWRGAIHTSNGTLPLVIHVTSDLAGKEYVTLDSPAQNTLGLPGDDVKLNKNKFSFDLPVLHGHYDGKLEPAGNTMKGTWTQGSSMPLDFDRDLTAHSVITTP